MTRAAWFPNLSCRHSHGCLKISSIITVPQSKLTAMQTLGVPYTDEQIANATASVEGKFEVEALVAYLQQLGTVIPNKR